MDIEANIPEAFQFLFTPSRYKAAYGGRGAAKSWNFARALIIKALESKKRILCAREIQNSIEQSVLKLLVDQIYLLGCQDYFHITKTTLTCNNGSEFFFKGLRGNITEIKSTEGIDLVWIEEAQDTTNDSYDILIPTIRKEGSEIWVSFNSAYEDDDTYVRWVTDPPDNCITRKINFDQNPYFPEVLRLEMESDKQKDFKLYEHKWLGIPHGGGRKIWSAFDPEVHVRTFEDDEIRDTANFFFAMDPHQHYYPACVWLAVIPMNTRRNYPEDFFFHFYNEWPKYDDLSAYYHEMRKKVTFTGTPAELSRNIYAGDGPGFKIRKRAMDTRFAKGSGSWSTTTQGIVEVYARPENGGLKFDLPPEKAIDVQRDVIHDAMHYNKFAEVGEYNQPRFSVSPKCKNLIMSLKNHRLEEIPPNRRHVDKEDEKFKDFSDAMRICFASLESWQDPNPSTHPGKYFSGKSWQG